MFAVSLRLDQRSLSAIPMKKFLRRFRYIEEKTLEKGKNLNNMTLVEMDNLWNSAKKLGFVAKKY